MTAQAVPSITNPSYFRAFDNQSGADIGQYLIVKKDTSGVDLGALATAVTDILIGVTTEIVYSGRSASVQRGGRGKVIAGAAVSIGDALTTDGQGRAITANQAPGAVQNTIGRAVTAASAAGDVISYDTGEVSSVYASVYAVADRAALKAITATNRFDGLKIMLKSDRSEWTFVATPSAALAADGADALVIAPTAGTGFWVRMPGAAVLRLPNTFATADAAALLTVPEGFVLRLTSFPYYEVTTGWTGGASSAIGLSTAKASYNTKGDLLGGAAGDVTATLGTVGVKAGTAGAKLGTLANMQGLVLVEGDILRFDRITSVYTAGAGNIMVPVTFDLAGPLTP
jgi:hypothetical protein